jgi:hypothetical protein
MASTIPVEPVTNTDGDSGFTIETLKEHGSRESMYMLLHGKVYDVTKFLDEVSGSSSYDELPPRWSGVLEGMP